MFANRHIRRRRRLVHAACLALSLTGPGHAQDVCGASLAACDIRTDGECLARTYACGEYDTIIAGLFAETLAPTPDQKYYLGAAFFQRQIRERAAGAQCEMVKFAREYLADYLIDVDAEFSRSQSFGTLRQMDQIYHANRMLTDVGEVPGCPESALTRARIASVAQAEADSYARDVFILPPPEALDAFGTLQLALRGVVSKASDLETGIALRQVELRSAATHLLAIRQIFTDIFGPVTGSGTAVVADTAILDGLLTRTRDMLREVQRQEDAFAAALGGVSPEAYANIRAQTVSQAEAFLKESAFHINMIGVLLPTDPARPFWQLRDALDADTPGKIAHDHLAQIRADWAAAGARSGICAQAGAADRVWYCR